MPEKPGRNDDQSAQRDLAYLQVELNRIDLLIRRVVRQWESAGQNTADDFRGLYTTSQQAIALASRPFGHNWVSAATLTTEAEAEIAHDSEDNQWQAQAIRETATGGQSLRLVSLVDNFNLSPFEYDAFLICLASALDLRYERIFGFLQDDITRRSPRVGLLLDLLLPTGFERLRYLDCFRDQAPLLRWGLLQPKSDESNLEPIIRRELIVAPEVVSWLLGAYLPATELMDLLHLEYPPFTQPPGVIAEIIPTVDWPQIASDHPIITLTGADQKRQVYLGQNAAEAMRCPLLIADLSGMKESGQLNPSSLRIILRDATLTGAIPLLLGWESLAGEDGAYPAYLQVELQWLKRPVMISDASNWHALCTNGDAPRPILSWRLDIPGYPLRQELWHYYIGGNGTVSREELDLIAGQFSLTAGQIQDAVAQARNSASQLGRKLQPEDLMDAARQQTSHHLDNLAVRIKPRYGWNDIVLPEEELAILHEIAATVRERPLVLDTWGLGKKLVPNRGISMLFAGPPGTGKTLAAQVIANELGMDLFKIDLSTVVSKYIGETEKNLERIFSQAKNSNTILFFDEADAIFGKRSEVKDAHDRYANIEVGYLLQRIESFDGVVILATNLRANLDEAFIRRLQFVVDFPFPDENQRLNIWKVLFPPTVPREEAIDFETLARRFKLSGGNIRNVIVNAVFLAANERTPVSMRHLLHGVRREMQKMGRLINEKEMAIG